MMTDEGGTMTDEGMTDEGMTDEGGRMTVQTDAPEPRTSSPIPHPSSFIAHPSSFIAHPSSLHWNVQSHARARHLASVRELSFAMQTPRQSLYGIWNGTAKSVSL